MSGKERKIMLRDVVANVCQARRISHTDWLAEGRRRFGDDVMKWKFVCPSCGHVASVQNWKDVGATEGEIAFSCVGRHLPNAKTLGKRPGPCNYAGGGLFKLNPVTVEMEDDGEADRFEFADEDPNAKTD